MIIVEQPYSTSFKNTIKPIKISGVDECTVKITHLLEMEAISNTVDLGKYTRTGSYIIINLKEFFSNDFVKSSNNLFADFKIEIKSASDVKILNLKVINGGVEGYNDNPESFLDLNWLTWQPQIKGINNYSLEYLGYWNTRKVYVKAYFQDKTSEEKLFEAPQTLLGINVSYTVINNLFEKTVLYYDVYFKSFDGTKISYTQRFYLDSEKHHAEAFFFKNSLGWYDTIYFTGEKKVIRDIKSNKGYLADNEKEINIEYIKKVEQNTGIIDNEELEAWLQEFFTSSEKYHLINGEKKRIVFDNIKSEKSSENDIESYNFTYRYSKQTKYQNLARTSGDLPQTYIEDLGSEIFFLDKRVIDLPEVGYDEKDFIIPGQVGFGSSWKKLYLRKAIKSIIDNSVDGETLLFLNNKLTVRATVGGDNGQITLAPATHEKLGGIAPSSADFNITNSGELSLKNRITLSEDNFLVFNSAFAKVKESALAKSLDTSALKANIEGKNYITGIEFNESEFLGTLKMQGIKISELNYLNGSGLRSSQVKTNLIVSTDTDNEVLINNQLKVFKNSVLVKDSLGVENFVSGAFGKGWNIAKSGDAEFNNIAVRGALSVDTFVNNKMAVNNGDLIISNTGEIESIEGFIITIKGENTFKVGNIIRCKTLDKEYKFKVQAINANTITYTEKQGTGAIEKGDFLVKVNGVVDKHLLYLSGSEGYFDVVYDELTKARFGNLQGINSPIWGNLNGHSLYAKNAYLENAFLDGKIKIKQGADDVTSLDATSIVTKGITAETIKTHLDLTVGGDVKMGSGVISFNNLDSDLQAQNDLITVIPIFNNKVNWYENSNISRGTNDVTSRDNNRISTNLFVEGDCSLEFQFTDINTGVNIGLAETNSDNGFTNIYSIYNTIGTNYYRIYENGIHNKEYTGKTQNTADILKIRYFKGVIKYYVNDVEFYNTSVGEGKRFCIRASTSTANKGVRNVKLSYLKKETQFTQEVNNELIKYNLSGTKEKFTETLGANSYAKGFKVTESYDKCRFQIEVDSLDKRKLVVLQENYENGNNPVGANFYCGLYLRDNYFYKWSKGNISKIRETPLKIGDILACELINGVVEFKLNEQVVHTENITDKKYFIRCCLYTAGCTLTNFKLFGVPDFTEISQNTIKTTNVIAENLKVKAINLVDKITFANLDTEINNKLTNKGYNGSWYINSVGKGYDFVFPRISSKANKISLRILQNDLEGYVRIRVNGVIVVSAINAKDGVSEWKEWEIEGNKFSTTQHNTIRIEHNGGSGDWGYIYQVYLEEGQGAVLTEITKNTISTTNVLAQNLQVNSANIKGKLTAVQIDTTNLHVSSSAVIEGTLKSPSGELGGFILKNNKIVSKATPVDFAFENRLSLLGDEGTVKFENTWKDCGNVNWTMGTLKQAPNGLKFIDRSHNKSRIVAEIKNFYAYNEFNSLVESHGVSIECDSDIVLKPGVSKEDYQNTPANVFIKGNLKTETINGVIIKRGSFTSNNDSWQLVYCDFPNRCFGAMIAPPYNSSRTDIRFSFAPGIYHNGKHGFTVDRDDDIDGNRSVEYVAFGY